MSFIQLTIRCRKCLYEMNIAEGTFGYGRPKECPKCKGEEFEMISYGWNAKQENNDEKCGMIKK